VIPEANYTDVGDGLRMHYQEAGQGPPVVFLHGSGPGASGYSNFKGNYPAFAEAGFRAVVPDTLGFGRSSQPDDIDYDLPFLAAAYARFLDRLGIARCALVGNSHGGALAIELALTHPERVSRLCLMAPGGLEERETYLKMEGIRAMVKAVMAPGGITREALAQVLRLQLWDPARLTEALIEERFAVARHQPKRVLTSLKVPHLAPRLPELACPVFGLWGTDDRFCPVSGAMTLATGCREARVLLLNRSGHWVMVEAAALFNRLCIDFLREAA
jgi:4,5:9,10-diseco-3-hydroxy-5,9,17-trioxoandrosta-1(10),2-diene-4-oate hydrolase